MVYHELEDIGIRCVEGHDLARSDEVEIRTLLTSTEIYRQILPRPPFNISISRIRHTLLSFLPFIESEQEEGKAGAGAGHDRYSSSCARFGGVRFRYGKGEG